MVKWFDSEKTVLLVLVFLSLCTKVFIINFLSIEVVSDAKAYWNMAISMLETNVMDDGQGNLAFYSSGYPLFLIPFIALFGKSIEVILYVNIALGVTSTLLVYLCSKVLLKDLRWAFLAALLWCFYPPNVMYTAHIAKENLMVPLLLIQLYLLLTYNGSLVKSALLGITFGIQLLVGAAVILTIIPVLFVLLKISSQSINAKYIKNVGIFILGCVISVTPWLSYTNTYLGSPVLNTNGGFNLYLGNNENSQVHFISITETPISDSWHKIREKEGEVNAFNKLKTIAVNYIFEHPIDTAILSVKKFFYFWTPPYHSGKGASPSTIEKLTRIVWLLYYLLIMLLFLASLLYFPKMKKGHFIVLAIVFLYTAIHVAAYVIFRYRIPIMPMVIMIAVSSLQFLYAQYLEAKKPAKYSD